MAEKASNVVLNFKMDGQVEYAKTIRDINAIMNAAASEYKTHVAAMGQDATATQKLAAEKKKLEIQLEAGRKRTEQLRTEYDAMAKSSKTTTGQLAAKHNQLMNSERAEIALANALDKVNEGLSEQAEESRKTQAAMDKLEKESSDLERQTGKLNAEYKLQEAQLGDNAKESEKLTLKTEQLNKQHELASEKVKNYEKQLELAKKQYGENSTEVDRYETQLLEAKTAEQQLANEIITTNKKLKEQNDVLANTSKSLKETGNKMKEVGKDLTMKVTAPVVGLGGVAAKSAIDFESAFAGVRKTVDATEAEFANLSEGIREMSTELPASASSIAQVAEAAGQLGIKKEAIMGFTRTMTDLGVATNMTSDEAATALARLANITQMSQDDFDRLGSSVVDLGNNFATTESEIIDMALRLAGAGAQVGMSEADILALSAALSSVGIEAEMGGSAISRVMVSMQVATSTGFSKVQELSDKTGLSLRDLQMMASHSGKAFGNLAEDLGMTKKELSTLVDAGADLEGFSKVAGMSGEQFKKAFEEDAIGALGSFINGLANAEEAGESAINMLQEMGITEIRLRDSLLRAGGASELFANAVKIGNNAWDENNALTKEAEERYKTTASQLSMLKNQVVDLGIDLGNILIPMILDVVNVVKPWIAKFKEMDDSTKKTMVVLAGLAAVIPPLIWFIGSMATGISALITIFTTVSGAIAVMTTGVAAATPAVGALASVFTVLTGPVGLVIAGIAALTVGVIALVKHLSKDALPEVERFGEGVSDATQEAVGGFMDMTDKADVALKELAWSQKTVTKEMADDMKAKQQEITDTLLSAIAERHSEEISQARQQLQALEGLSEEQKNNIIEKINERFSEEKEITEQGNARIQEIWERAKNNNRGITEQEAKEISSIRQSMVEQAVVVMSENEMEQKLIYEKMKENASVLSAEESAEVVRNASEKKNSVIDEANSQYDETYKWAVRQRDELGNMSAEEAQAVIDEAKKKRDESIRNAEEMHSKVVEQAKLQAEEHVDKVNWETGEILSKWEVFKNGVFNKTKEITKEIAIGWSNSWTSTKATTSAIKNIAEEKFAEMVTSVLGNMIKLKSNVVSKWNEAQDFLANIDLQEIGKDIISGLTKGITEKTKAVAEAIKGVADRIKSVFRKEMDIHSPSREMEKDGFNTGIGVAKGIEATIAANEKAISGVTNVIKKVTNAHSKEMRAIASKQAAEEKSILQKKNRDIANIHSLAKSKKRGLTLQENQRIQKIEEQAAQQLVKTQQKYASERTKIESNLAKDRLEAIKLYIRDKQSLNQMSLVAEAVIWERSIKQFKAGTKERIEAQKAYQSAVEAVNKEIESINKTHLDQINMINSEFIKGAQQLNDEYNKVFEGRVDFIRNSVSLFDEFVSRFDGSGRTLLENLRSQVVGLEEWRSTLQSLWGKIDDQALMEELEAMGPKAAGELKALNSLSESELAEYVSLYNRKFAEAREQATWELRGLKENTEYQISMLREAANTKLDQVKSDWIKAIQKITLTTNNEFKTLESIGKKAGQNLLDGLSSMEDSLVAKARSIAAAVNAAMQGAFNISGPSVNMANISFDTKWNAKGGIFTQPTIFGASGGKLQGAGEAGPEAVLPLNAETLGAIGEGIAKTMKRDGITQHIQIVSPDPTSPSENARQMKRAAKQLAMEW